MSGSARVGYVLEGFPRPSETFVVTEILAREAYGESIVVFRLRAPEGNDPHGRAARVTAPIVDVPGDSDDAQGAALADIALARGVTHLHAHFANTATTVARLASRKSGIGYSFTAHAMDIFSPVARPDDLAAKIRDASFVVTVSDYNLAFLRRIAPDAPRLSRLYNGLDLERFPFAPRPFAGAPARVLGVGRLVEKKGFRHLIDAVAVLREHGEDVTLDIVGSGALEADLGQRIAASGHADVMRLLGARPQHDVAALLQKADVFVAPSVVASDGDADGLPTVLLEAMATGVPTVATAVTGIPEIVRTGETGMLVPPADPPALADAIAATISTGFPRSSVVASARNLVEREFDARRQALSLVAMSAEAR
jgi:glycosyltransferase involved in cell wall biosynthesis